MSRILFAWELGSGYGHINGFVAIAQRLRERGHTVLFALKDLSRAEKLLGESGYEFMQAPVWLPAAPDELPPIANYAEMLFRFGYLDTFALTGMLKAWRSVYRAAGPDLVLFNHAPTAQLASRGQLFARLSIGTGYTCRPPVDRLPSLTPGIPATRLNESEKHATRVMNSALARLGDAPMLNTFADLVRDIPSRLCTFAELDPFHEYRDSARYAGPLMASQGGADVHWQQRKRARIFAYLKYEDPRTRRALHELCALPAELVVHIPGLEAAEASRLRAAGANVSMHPVDMQLLRDHCDLVVCHAGHAMTATALVNGNPLMCLPTQAEQLATAQRVAAMGAGLYMGAEHGPEHFSRSLRQLVGQPRFRNAARRFAQQHADFNQDVAVDELAREVEALISAR